MLISARRNEVDGILWELESGKVIPLDQIMAKLKHGAWETTISMASS